jgi:hypothetical protein
VARPEEKRVLVAVSFDGRVCHLMASAKDSKQCESWLKYSFQVAHQLVVAGKTCNYSVMINFLQHWQNDRKKSISNADIAEELWQLMIGARA